MQVMRQPKDPEQIVRDLAPTPFHAMRRKELERVLVHSGIKVKNGATHKFMIMQAQEATVPLTDPPPGWKMPSQQVPVVAEPPAFNPFEPQAYGTMGMPQLRKLAKLRGLKQSTRDKKIDLIEKLNGQDAS